MRRQLSLARRLIPLLVRQRLRREAAAGALDLPTSDAADALRSEARAVAAAAIDGLDAQVDQLVADVFSGFGATERITFDQWVSSWQMDSHGDSAATREAGQGGGVHRIIGIDGVLGLASLTTTSTSSADAPQVDGQSDHSCGTDW